MTKEDFVGLLEAEFVRIAKDVRLLAEKQIQEKSVSVDATSFKTWLRAEQAAALQTPALKVFDSVLRASMGTPKDAAQAIADFIAFDHTVRGWPLDWLSQSERAFQVLNGRPPEKWKYRENITQYVRAIQAEERAKSFSEGCAALTLLLRWQPAV